MISGCFFSDISRMIPVYMGTMGVQSRIKDIATSFSYLMPKMALSYKRYTQHKNKNVPGRRAVFISLEFYDASIQQGCLISLLNINILSQLRQIDHVNSKLDRWNFNCIQWNIYPRENTPYQADFWFYDVSMTPWIKGFEQVYHTWNWKTTQVNHCFLFCDVDCKLITHYLLQ